MLNVVLVEPQIPSNTGNVGRTCVLVGARLHLVGPLGFSLDEKSLQRAGMAYWHEVDLHVWRSWDELVEASDLLDQTGRLVSGVHLFTKAACARHSDARYADGDWLVLGNEASGLPRQLIDANPQRCVRIPMLPDARAFTHADEWHARHADAHPELERDIAGNFVDERAGQIASLNLSNAAAIAIYEALRQTGYLGLE